MGRGITTTLALFLLPLLHGCGAIQNAITPPYVPSPIHIYDQAQYDADNAECKTAGLAYKPGVSYGEAVTDVVNGATSNTSLIPVSPLTPAYGAGGGIIEALNDGLDLASNQHNNVYFHCLHDETQIDKSAVIANPRP